MTPRDAPKNNISKTVKCRELYGANNQTSPMHVKLCMGIYFWSLVFRKNMPSTSPCMAQHSSQHFHPQLCPVNSSGVVFCAAAHFYVSRLSFRAIAFYPNQPLPHVPERRISFLPSPHFCCCHICLDHQPYHNPPQQIYDHHHHALQY